MLKDIKEEIKKLENDIQEYKEEWIAVISQKKSIKRKTVLFYWENVRILEAKIRLLKSKKA